MELATAREGPALVILLFIFDLPQLEATEEERTSRDIEIGAPWPVQSRSAQTGRYR